MKLNLKFLYRSFNVFLTPREKRSDGFNKTD